MRLRFGAVFAVTAALGLALPITGCGDDDDSTTAETFVYVDGVSRPGSACPSGTTEAYRDRDTIVCHSCRADADCNSGHLCALVCGPGCEDDTGSCCGVWTCLAFVGALQDGSASRAAAVASSRSDARCGAMCRTSCARPRPNESPARWFLTSA